MSGRQSWTQGVSADPQPPPPALTLDTHQGRLALFFLRGPGGFCHCSSKAWSPPFWHRLTVGWIYAVMIGENSVGGELKTIELINGLLVEINA